MILASILTGALLFIEIPGYSQDSIAIADTLRLIDRALLVNSDTSLKKPILIDTTFTENDTVRPDSKEDTMKLKRYRSPMISGLFSAIVPGFGQAYNHKYWKIPFIYIGGGLLVYYSAEQNTLYNKYIKLYNEEYFKPSEKQNKTDLETYARIRDGYRKNRDRLLLYTGLVYAANIVDAIVDAYFSEFDISNDLSLKVKPVVAYPEYALGNISYGVSIRLKF